MDEKEKKNVLSEEELQKVTGGNTEVKKDEQPEGVPVIADPFGGHVSLR